MDKSSRDTKRAAYKARTEHRLERCRTCIPHYTTHRAAPATCSACGCLVAVKVRLPGEKCPKGRW